MEDKNTEISLVNEENACPDDNKINEENVEVETQNEMKFTIEDKPVWYACTLLGLQVVYYNTKITFYCNFI